MECLFVSQAGSCAVHHSSKTEEKTSGSLLAEFGEVQMLSKMRELI